LLNHVLATVVPATRISGAPLEPLLATISAADFLTALPRRASMLAALFGAAALAGWSADIDIMRRPLPCAPTP
jgi:hypothetical protein